MKGLTLLSLLTASVSASVLPAKRDFVVVNDTITVTLPATNDALSVHLRGATITSWIPGDGVQKLFLSKGAPLSPGGPPEFGGIPVIFPNFCDAGPGQNGMPFHGFARNSTWRLLSAGKSPNAATEIEGIALVFGLSSTDIPPEWQAAWPYKVNLTYTITLSPMTLQAKFNVLNVDTKPVDFQFELQTFLSVPNVQSTTIAGLEGSTYIDKRDNYTIKPEGAYEVRLPANVSTDRVYRTPGRPSAHGFALSSYTDPDGNGSFQRGTLITILRETDNLPTVTVWNVGPNGALNFDPRSDWDKYLTVEPGAVGQWPGVAGLGAGQSWEASVKYSAPYHL